jgi:hypothetical protein
LDLSEFENGTRSNYEGKYSAKDNPYADILAIPEKTKIRSSGIRLQLTYALM